MGLRTSEGADPSATGLRTSQSAGSREPVTFWSAGPRACDPSQQPSGARPARYHTDHCCASLSPTDTAEVSAVERRRRTATTPAHRVSVGAVNLSSAGLTLDCGKFLMSHFSALTNRQRERGFVQMASRCSVERAVVTGARG